MGILTPKTRNRIFPSGSILTVLLALVTIFACQVEEPIPTYTLTTSVTPSEGGKISVSPQESNYIEGSQITLTPEPNENWIFKQWEGDATGSTTPLQITMTSNKSITGVFVKRDYPLNIKIEGEGTVEEKIVPNPSGREYPHGTTVELTPKPKEGWEFDSWSGDLSGNENPKRITVDKQKNVTAKFKESLIYSKTVEIDLIYPEVSQQALTSTIYHFPAKVYMTTSGQEYIIHNPSARLTDNNSFEYVGPIQLKRENEQWRLDKIYKDIKIGNSRNTHILNNNSYLVSSAPELPGGIGVPDQDYWVTMENGSLTWKKINPELRWSHDISGGDLNNDGLMDVVCATPLSIFLQNANGTFTKRDDLYKWEQRISAFAVEVADVMGDITPEIITGGYFGSGNPLQRNNLAVYTLNKQTGKFEIIFDNQNPNIFFDVDLGATSIEVHDFDKDGKKDIAVAREGGFNERITPLRTIEVWKGDGNGNFTYLDKIQYSQDQLDFTEFICKDVNNDGYIDIILNGNGGGDLFRVKNQQGAWVKTRLNHLIQLNDGKGNFSPFNGNDLDVEGAPNVPDYLYPFMRSNKLYFFGTHTKQNIANGIRVTYWDVKLNIF